MKMKRYSNHYDTAKMIVGLLVVLIAFGMFLFLNSYSDVIYEENNPNTFYLFVVLVAAACALLIGLMYVVSNSKEGNNVSHKKASAKSAKKIKHKKSSK